MSSGQICYLRDCQSDGCSGGQRIRHEQMQCQHRHGGHSQGNQNTLTHEIDLGIKKFIKHAQQWVSTEWGETGMADGKHEGIDGNACQKETCNLFREIPHKSTYCIHKNYSENKSDCCLGYYQRQDDEDFPLLGENYLSYNNFTLTGATIGSFKYAAVFAGVERPNLLFTKASVPHTYKIQYMDRLAYPTKEGQKQTNMLSNGMNEFYLALDCTAQKVHWTPEDKDNKWKVTQVSGNYVLENISDGFCLKTKLAIGSGHHYLSMTNTRCGEPTLDGIFHIFCGSRSSAPSNLLLSRNCANSRDDECISGDVNNCDVNVNVYLDKPKTDTQSRPIPEFEIKPKSANKYTIQYTWRKQNLRQCNSYLGVNGNSVQWVSSEHLWEIKQHSSAPSKKQYENWYTISSNGKFLNVSSNCGDNGIYVNNSKTYWRIEKLKTANCVATCDATPACKAFEQTNNKCLIFKNLNPKQGEGVTCHALEPNFEVMTSTAQTLKVRIEPVPPANQLRWIQWRHFSAERASGGWKDPHASFMKQNYPSYIGSGDMQMSLYVRDLKDPRYTKLYPQNEHIHYNSKTAGYSSSNSTQFDPCHEKFVTKKTCNPMYYRGSEACKGEIYPEKCKDLNYVIEKGLDERFKRETSEYGGCLKWFETALKGNSGSNDYKRAVTAANEVCVANEKNGQLADVQLQAKCEKWSQQYPSDFVPYIQQRCTTGDTKQIKNGKLGWNERMNKNTDDPVCGALLLGKNVAAIRKLSESSEKRKKAHALIDAMAESYCNNIQNRRDPRCACFYHPTASAQPWQKEQGAMNYADLSDLEKALPAACVVSKCRAADHAFRTNQHYNTIDDECPKCLQSIGNKVWSSNWQNVKQMNVCALDGTSSTIQNRPSTTPIEPTPNGSGSTPASNLCSLHETELNKCCDCVGSTFTIADKIPTEAEEKAAIAECVKTYECSSEKKVPLAHRLAGVSKLDFFLEMTDTQALLIVIGVPCLFVAIVVLGAMAFRSRANQAPLQMMQDSTWQTQQYQSINSPTNIDAPP